MATPSLVIVPDRYKAGKLYSQIPVDGAGDFTVTRGTTATRVNASGLIESVASGVPRLDYTGGGCPSLLVEPAATNLALRSEEFDNASWVAQGLGVAAIPIVTANAGVAPDGTTTAERVQFDCVDVLSSSNRSNLIQNITILNATAYTGSIWIKAFDAGNVGKTVRIGTGPVAAQTFTLTANWQRVSYSGTSVSTVGNFIIETRGTLTTQTADLLIWGAQLETGSVATSYIPTVASTVTRNADAISLSSVSGLIGQTQGTIYAEVSRTANAAPNRRIIFLGDNANNYNNRIDITGSGTGFGDRIAVLVSSAGVTQYNFTTTSNFLGAVKVAIGYSSSGVSFYINGALINELSSSISIPSLSTIALGGVDNQSKPGASTAFLNDRIRAAAIYTSRLSNAELQSLTQL